MAPTAICRDDATAAAAAASGISALEACATRGRRPQLLFIDAFDSFTNNIVGLLERSLNAAITLVRIDDESVRTNLAQIVRQVDAVVVGPGPGHPANPEDVGLIDRLWDLVEEAGPMAVPVLGICLGFQSLCSKYGGVVRNLRMARHGLVREVEHCGGDIFSGVGFLEATQYHSLYVDLGGGGREPGVSWEPTEQCPDLVPLAWDVKDDVNGPLLMGVRHVEKPLWGVQFHPESICTSESGAAMIENWWLRARTWTAKAEKMARSQQHQHVNGLPPKVPYSAPAYAPKADHHSLLLARELSAAAGTEDIFLRWGRHSAANISATEVVEALGLVKDEVIVLDSQGHGTGRFSIVGVLTPGKTVKICYDAYTRVMRYGTGWPMPSQSVQLESVDQIWPMLQDATDLHDPSRKGYHRTSASRASSPGPEMARTGMDRYISGHLPEDSPFWGGFMGYVSYEAGLGTIRVDLDPSCASGNPDINFAFVHRSIVIDHETEQIYIQSLLPGDWLWILDVGRTVDAAMSRIACGQPKLSTPSSASTGHSVREMLANAQLTRPTAEAYKAKVLQCQDALARGDSYELCLTDESEIRVPATDGLDPWLLYKQLRRNNPAPFGAYLRLSGATIVGSSPERFLRWTRRGRCQFRPIKGTVKKGPGVTSEMAHAILGSSKERAENLMIVDLIRHDLAGVIGAENTWVPKLMVVEEYEKVYQLVSVVEGQMRQAEDEEGELRGGDPKGIDVLRASLPPGSMTGAPKKRSCEILRDLEHRPRGVYSGVLGYLDVGGGGDFSVVIRTAVRHDDNPVDGRRRDSSDVWKVGAGGAVTIQSTAQGEFEEMETKASSVLDALLNER